MWVKGDKKCTRIPKGTELQEKISQDQHGAHRTSESWTEGLAESTQRRKKWLMARNPSVWTLTPPSFRPHSCASRLSPPVLLEVTFFKGPWIKVGFMSLDFGRWGIIRESVSKFQYRWNIPIFQSVSNIVGIFQYSWNIPIFQVPILGTQWTEKRKISNRGIAQLGDKLSCLSRLGPWACTILFQRGVQNRSSGCIEMPGLLLCCPWSSTPPWWTWSVRGESVPVSSDLEGTRQVWIVLVSLYGFLCSSNGIFGSTCPLQRRFPLKELNRIQMNFSSVYHTGMLLRALFSWHSNHLRDLQFCVCL